MISSDGKKFIDAVNYLLQLTDFKDDKDLSKWQDEFFLSGEYFDDASLGDEIDDIPRAWNLVKKEIGDLPICISREDTLRLIVENADCWYGDSFFDLFESLIDSYKKEYQDVGTEDFALFELEDSGVKICVFSQDMSDEPMYYLPRETFKALENIGKDGKGILPSQQELTGLCEFLVERDIVDSTFYDNVVDAIDEISQARKEDTREINADEFLTNVKEILSDNGDKLAFEKTMSDYQDAINGWDELVGKLLAEVRAFDRFRASNDKNTVKDYLKQKRDFESAWISEYGVEIIEDRYGIVLSENEVKEIGNYLYDSVEDSNALNEYRDDLFREAIEDWMAKHDKEYRERGEAKSSKGKEVAEEAKDVAKGGSSKSAGRDIEER